ncbi:alpha-L-Rha alpha-1,3-L-rhamnosyltransferase [Silvibacterium dinghuense]|nr:alpha-L-Rha alpha-1,3-L-rhamnosyltransferase [Silvibacterium dinghuense]
MQNSMPLQIVNQDTQEFSRPAVSVCMASYNGEKFIEAQLKSILDQLSDADEVIVVDDASTDSTCERVLAFRDARIHLIQHQQNTGVVRTFEEAIRLASRPIIILADQDDVWAQDKVQTVTRKFLENPKLMLVAHDATLIDENDQVLGPSFLALRGGFSSGLWSNLWKNRYVGCTLAFHSELRREILPFPHQYDVLHDMWIGVRCAWIKTPIEYIDRPLILYRRHSGTATGRKQNNPYRKSRLRIDLLAALFSFCRRI